VCYTRDERQREIEFVSNKVLQMWHWASCRLGSKGWGGGGGGERETLIGNNVHDGGVQGEAVYEWGEQMD